MYRFGDKENYCLGKCENDKATNRFKVLGKGTVSVRPDVAEVVIGVTTENLQLQEAQEENAKKVQQIIDGVKGIGVLPRHIQTERFSIRPSYDYIDGKQIFRGYEVSNSLKILIKDLSSVGEIIDTSVKNGANNISGIGFSVSDITKYYYEALRLAVEDAQNKASIMANKLKVKLNNTPIEINEQDKGTIAPLTVAAFKSIAENTPIEAGENKITADIEAVFIYTS